MSVVHGLLSSQTSGVPDEQAPTQRVPQGAFVSSSHSPLEGAWSTLTDWSTCLMYMGFHRRS